MNQTLDRTILFTNLLNHTCNGIAVTQVDGAIKSLTTGLFDATQALADFTIAKNLLALATHIFRLKGAAGISDHSFFDLCFTL